MLSVMRQILVGTLGLTLLAIGTARGEETPHLTNIALIDQPWAVALDITGYRVQADGVKPDGRRYFLATNRAASMTLSVTLEGATSRATEQGCLAHLERIARTSPAHRKPEPMRYEIRRLPVVEYLLPETADPQTAQLHLFACISKDNVYTDIHVSKTGFTPGDDSQLRYVLASLDIVTATTATSLDHFRAGSAPYLQGNFGQAIPHYEQALALERANSALDKALWRLLVHNLGTAYGRTGDLQHAKATWDYGLSQDPANPLFHYHLARTYAAMNDPDQAMQSLHAAFRNHRRQDAGESIPDPRQDISFRRLMLDPVFRTLTESLMLPAI